MRKLGLIGLFGLAACTDITPPTTPAPATIATEANALAQAQLAGDPNKYVKVGYELVERECGNFFDALDKAEDQATFASQELNLAGTAAAGILGALKAGVTPITIAGIAFPLAPNSILNYQKSLLLTAYPDETYSLVKSGLKTYCDNSGNPADIYDAVGLVQNYAAICTYSGIHSLAKQAIATATTTTKRPPPSGQQPPPARPAAGTPSPAAPSPRPLIPNVIVQPAQ
jgi:hypothetical protein